MPWYINYEVEFDEQVDWNDNEVKRCLETFNCNFLYLRNMAVGTVIFSIEDKCSIVDILCVIYDLYVTDMNYKQYGTRNWIKFKYP